MAAPRPASSVPFVPLGIGLALAIGGFFYLHGQGSPAPYGVPLPKPKPQLISEGVEIKDTDVLQGRIPPPFLEFLAPQPDGAVPLRYPFHSDRGDFSISHPMGTEMTFLTREQFQQTGIDAIGEVQFNQPLKQIRYLMPPRREKEKVTEYVARQRYELQQRGARFMEGQSDPVELPRYRFERLEYSITPQAEDKQQFGDVAGGEEYHLRYIGPLGPRVLIADYITTPDLADKARAQADKIVRSFNPGWQLYGVMKAEDPEYLKKQAAAEEEEKKAETAGESTSPGTSSAGKPAAPTTQ